MAATDDAPNLMVAGMPMAIAPAGTLSAVGHHSTSANRGASADDGSMQDHTVRPDQARVLDLATLQMDQVPDDASGTYDGGEFRCRMDDRAVLDRGACPNDHRPEVAAEHGARPHRGFWPQPYVTDDYCVGMDECVGMDVWYAIVLVRRSAFGDIRCESRSKTLRDWLLGDLRFELHTAPTYGWWMTVAEWWFTELAEQGLGRSPTELAASIKEWIQRWNEIRAPTTGIESADEIVYMLFPLRHVRLWLRTREGPLVWCCQLTPKSASVRVWLLHHQPRGRVA